MADLAMIAFINQVQKEFEKSLQPTAEKLGVTFRWHGSTYTDGSFTSKLLVTKVSAEDKKSGLNADEIKWKNNIKRFGRPYGLELQDYGKSFSAHGETFIFLGIEANRKAFIIARNTSNNKTYKFRDLYDEGLIEKIKSGKIAGKKVEPKKSNGKTTTTTETTKSFLKSSDAKTYSKLTKAGLEALKIGKLRNYVRHLGGKPAKEKMSQAQMINFILKSGRR